MILFLYSGALDAYLRSYVEKYKFLTITSVEWKENFLQYFNKQVYNNNVVLHTYVNNLKPFVHS